MPNELYQECQQPETVLLIMKYGKFAIEREMYEEMGDFVLAIL